ncbi:MAG: hypothetical protein QOE04_5584 [Mycobacterium sp.]|nr:hypothetical protein [Mycobacterium sp.]
MKGLPSMQPTGWFQVAWSADIAEGEVIGLRYFGVELVAFRDRQGAVHVLNAHCQHLGANLSKGGCVVEDGIQCPFHGWVWNGDGRNVRIPYENRPNRGRKVRSWPVAELNESIYLWHDASGRAPMWQVPDGLKVLGDHIHDRAYLPVGPEARIRFAGIHVHPQVIAENAVDPHHFRFVHKTPVSPTVLREDTDEVTWSAKVGFGRRWSDGVDQPGETTNTLEIYWSGLGIAFNGEHTREGYRVIAICATPVDDATSDIFSTYWIDEANGRYEERLTAAQAALPDDIAIWDSQVYMDPPGLTTSEAAGFKQLRNWARGFYPDSESAASEPAPSGVR